MAKVIRAKEFQRNNTLDSLLKVLNNTLKPTQENLNKKLSTPEYPVFFVVGSPRSGTTLLMQYLAETGLFGYPSNMLSRFYEAPYIGALVHEMLFNPEYNYNNELLDLSDPINFKSQLGKTKGASSPNEFWFFWRRFFEFDESQEIDKVQFEDTTWIHELASMESVFRRPLIFKGLNFNCNIKDVYSSLSNVFFLYTKRDLTLNVQSLLKARERFSGSQKNWYSFKPPEYKNLKKLDPVGQVTGQIYYTNDRIEKSLSNLPPEKYAVINYEEFCLDPKSHIQVIAQKYSGLEAFMKDGKISDIVFEPSNTVNLDATELSKIDKYLDSFKNVMTEKSV